MSELTGATVVVRRGHLLTAAVGDDLVMLDPEQGRYFGVDRVGHRVWDLLEQPRTVADLCSELEGKFNVTPDRCGEDVRSFVRALEDAGLVEVR